MKLDIRTLLDDYEDSGLPITERDVASCDRIQEDVMNHIQTYEPRRRRGRTVLFIGIAAALLAVSALAAGIFGMSIRTPEPGESFSYRDVTGEQRELFGDATLVLEFEGPDTCQKIRVRPGWVPFGPDDYSKNCFSTDDWYDYISAWDMPVESRPEEYREVGGDPWQVNIFYAPQFTNGGHALLQDYEARDITETEMNGCRCLYFSAVRHQEEIILDDGTVLPEKDWVKNYVLLFQETEGYMLQISGDMDMEVLLQIARGLEVLTLEETVSSADLPQGDYVFNSGIG